MKKKEEYVKSDPYFFRIILISMFLVIFTIIILSFFINAPLKTPADPSSVPNPSKAAWFLLWIQEAVSYSNYYIYIVTLILIFYFLLPFLPIKTEPKGVWFRKSHWLINSVTLIVLFGIIAFTIIGYFFRGEFWQLTF